MRIPVDWRFCRAQLALLIALSFAGAALCRALPRQAGANSSAQSDKAAKKPDTSSPQSTSEQSSSPGTEKPQKHTQTQTPAKPETNSPANTRNDSARPAQAQQSDSASAAGSQGSAKGSGSNASDGAAEKQPPPQAVVVWVNTSSKVYHLSGSRWYGRTRHGRYMTERDAIKAGYHRAGKE